MPPDRDRRNYTPDQKIVDQLLTDHYAASGQTHAKKDQLLARFEEAYEKYGLIFEAHLGKREDRCLEEGDKPFPKRYYDRDYKDYLAIYRGFKHFAELDPTEMSISWTFAFKKAVGSRGQTDSKGMFPHYPFPDGTFPQEVYIARVLIHPRDVLAWFPCRGENEAVFRPAKAFLIEVKHFPVEEEEYEIEVTDHSHPSYYSARPTTKPVKRKRFRLKGEIQEWSDLTF